MRDLHPPALPPRRKAARLSKPPSPLLVSAHHPKGVGGGFKRRQQVPMSLPTSHTPHAPRAAPVTLHTVQPECISRATLALEAIHKTTNANRSDAAQHLPLPPSDLQIVRLHAHSSLLSARQPPPPPLPPPPLLQPSLCGQKTPQNKKARVGITELAVLGTL